MKTFNQLKQSLNEGFSYTDGINEKLIEDAIHEAMIMVPLAQKWHFQTSSYSIHEALDSFYTGLKDKSDSLAETWMAVGGKMLNEYTATIKPFESSEDMIRQIESFRNKILTALTESEKDNRLKTVQDQLNGILQLVDSFAYMLNFE